MSNATPKKRGTLVLVCMGLVFLSFALGFFLGRNFRAQGVQTEYFQKPTESETAAATELPEPYPVNINTADEEQLMLLPGIGRELAQRIIDYRGEYGSFSSLNELLNIEGIGENRLEQLMPYATTGGRSQ